MITFQCSDIDISGKVMKPIKPVFKKTDFHLLSELLGDIETNDIIGCNDPDEAYAILEERIVLAVDKSTKLITPKSKHGNQWFDHELIKLRIKRQRFHNVLKKDRTTANKRKYTEVDKAYNKLIIQKKKEYNHRRLDKYKFDLKPKWV